MEYNDEVFVNIVNNMTPANMIELPLIKKDNENQSLHNIDEIEEKSSNTLNEVNIYNIYCMHVYKLYYISYCSIFTFLNCI